MNLRSILKSHDPADAFATVQRMVDHADRYQVLFGYKHRWSWDDGTQAWGIVNRDGYHARVLVP